MELLEVVFLVIASTALVLAAVALLRLMTLERRVRYALFSLNSKILKQVVKSLEKRKKYKNRYLVVRLVTPKNISLNELQRLLNEAFIELYGRKSCSEASPRILYFNEKTMKAVIRVRSNYRWSALLALAYLERRDFISYVCPERVTGTYRKARKYAEIV